MKTLLAAVCLLVMAVTTQAQNTTLPVKAWVADGTMPYVFYISGDGGLNNFSTSLCTGLNKAGYAVSALNARSYFWSRKTPDQTAGDLGAYLVQQLSGRKNQQVILIGYSFGADVLPFIVNRFPESLKKNLLSAILLAPSTSTDFEIHLSDMLGSGAKRSMDVVAETNKLTVPRIVTVFGKEDSSFPVQDLKLRNYRNEVLPGGHHFEGNVDEVVKTVLEYVQ